MNVSEIIGALGGVVKDKRVHVVACTVCALPFASMTANFGGYEFKDEICDYCRKSRKDLPAPSRDASTCATCGKLTFPYVVACHNGHVQLHVCVNADCQAYEEGHKRLTEASTAIRVRGWRLVTPVEYQNVDRTRLPCVDAYDEALRFDPRGKRGLYMLGPTGRGKTRALHQITRKAAEANISFLVLTANEFGNRAASLFSESPTEGEKWEQRIKGVGLLCFDDLGKGPLTERMLQTLFSVVEYRTARGRPTIVSTNDTQATMQARARDTSILEPLFRRLDEFCDVVRFLLPSER